MANPELYTPEIKRRAIRLAQEHRQNFLARLHAEFGENDTDVSSEVAFVKERFAQTSSLTCEYVFVRDNQRLRLAEVLASDPLFYPIETKNSGAFYNKGLDAVFVFRNQEMPLEAESFMTRRKFVHELAHSIKLEDSVVKFKGEDFNPYDALVKVNKENNIIFVNVTQPRMGLRLVGGWGAFFEEAKAEYIATAWAKDQLTQGRFSGIFRQIYGPDFDPRLTDQLSLRANIPEIGSFSVPLPYLMIDNRGGLNLSVSTYPLMGLEILCERDPEMLPYFFAAANGDLESLREFPKRVDRLLGKGAYGYLQKRSKDEELKTNFKRGLTYIVKALGEEVNDIN